MMILTLEEGVITLIALGLFFLMYFRQEKTEELVKEAFEFLELFFFGFLFVFPTIWTAGIILKILLFIAGVNFFPSIIELGLLGIFSWMLALWTGVPNKIYQWATQTQPKKFVRRPLKNESFLKISDKKIGGKKMIKKIVLVGLLLFSGCLSSIHANEGHTDVAVEKKMIDYSGSEGGSGSHYILITDKGPFEVDRPILDIFDSSKNPDIIFGRIAEGQRYRIHHYGYRIDWLYDYPIVTGADKLRENKEEAITR